MIADHAPLMIFERRQKSTLLLTIEAVGRTV